MSASLAIGAGEPPASRFAAERFLTGRVLSFVDDSGIARLLAERREFSLGEAAAALEQRLRFVLADPVRFRMLRVLVEFLAECGSLRPAAGGRYAVVPGDACPGAPGLAGQVPGGLAADGQVEFFERCLSHAPAFLRGGAPLFDFDHASAGAWDRLLGNQELARARAILARLVLPRDNRRCDVLVLCYGPGFDLVEIENRCPAARVTALDFTNAFFDTASRRLNAPARVEWPAPASWGGFGRRLPFRDGSFDLVVLTCAEPYIPAPDRRFVFDDLHRVLRPGGVVGLLTHAYPDPSRLAVPDEWVRRVTYCHDFLESVCRGWQGFSQAAALRELFEESGFRVDLVTHNSSVWRLSRPPALHAAPPGGLATEPERGATASSPAPREQ